MTVRVRTEILWELLDDWTERPELANQASNSKPEMDVKLGHLNVLSQQHQSKSDWISSSFF